MANAPESFEDRLAQWVETEKAKTDAASQHYLDALNEHHREAMAHVEVRKQKTVLDAILQRGNMTAAKIRQVEKADWPQAMKDVTIQDLLKLYDLSIREMMKQLDGQ